jgi:hypothetical protein
MSAAPFDSDSARLARSTPRALSFFDAASAPSEEPDSISANRIGVNIASRPAASPRETARRASAAPALERA